VVVAALGLLAVSVELQVLEAFAELVYMLYRNGAKPGHALFVTLVLVTELDSFYLLFVDCSLSFVDLQECRVDLLNKPFEVYFLHPHSIGVEKKLVEASPKRLLPEFQAIQIDTLCPDQGRADSITPILVKKFFHLFVAFRHFKILRFVGFT